MIWMRRHGGIFGGLLLAACSGGAENTTSGPLLGESTSTTDGPSTTTDEGTTVAQSGSADGTSTSTGPADPDSTSTTEAGSSSGGSSGGCDPGTELCSCDVGACEGDLICVDDVCLAEQCDGDLFEPNETEDDAVDLGEINDCDGNAGIVSGSLHSAGDVDWYRYHGDDDFGCNVDPARDLAASGGVRLCKFLECDNGLAETEFECPVGTNYALSPQARPGCCADAGFALPDLNCTGVTEDLAMVYIRVDQSVGDCVNYSVSYHY